MTPQHTKIYKPSAHLKIMSQYYQTIKFYTEAARADIKAGRIRAATFRKWKNEFLDRLVSENFEVLVAQGTIACLPREVIVGGETPGVKKRAYQIAHEVGLDGYIESGMWYAKHLVLPRKPIKK